jgi:tRNA(Ile)-lysidine synthase
MALLILLHDWADRTGRRIEAVTVDHGLRPESGAEAAAVAVRCAALGVPHAVRVWPGAAAQGNLQAAARAARQRLIGDWARSAGLGSVALGHTLDDQAETFLMRLARGSGVDGLAAMHPVQRMCGTVWLRPLLGLRRAELRRWLAARGESWVEDPGNEDLRFDRVRARAALAPLAGLGLGAERLAETAGQLGRAREALEAAALEAARRALEPGRFGELRLSPAALEAAPAEIRLRVLAGALAWVSGAIYRPRLVRLKALLETIEAGRLGHGATLHGCVLRPSRGAVAIRREPARVAPAVPADTALWDGRWELAAGGMGGAGDAGITLGAVGREGLAQWPGWRESGAAREVAETTPGLWRARRLVAAPLLGLEPAVPVRHVAPVFDPWTATLLR